MGHGERCYHTTAPVALALGGIQRMQACLGTAIDRQFVSALVARLPGIAEQGRARMPRARTGPVYRGAFECTPVHPAGPLEGLSGLRACPSSLPRLPLQRLTSKF